jgi:hypothetical protein
MRCLGIVLLSIIFVAGIAIAGFTALGALFWLTAATANFFQLGALSGGLILTGYMVLIFGVIVGAAICKDNVAA